jgi:flagellar hook-length control protein FliK
MPDQAGKGSPSSTPLSAEDADRLAESFTPFWDDGETAALPAATSVVPAAKAQPSAAPLPSAEAPAAKKALNKQTLLGMAPFPVGASATVTPLGLNKKTLFGFSAPSLAAVAAPSPPTPTLTTAPAPAPAASATGPAVPAPTPAAVPAPTPARGDSLATPLAVRGRPDVPGYAIAYTPKDRPSTPPVVIAPEAQSSPDASKRPLSNTVPSRVRSGPLAMPEAAALASAPAAAPAPLASSATDDIDDTHPPKSRTGVLVFAGVGGVVLLIAVGTGIRALSRTSAPVTSAAPSATAAAIASSRVAAPPIAEPVAATSAMPVEAAPITAPSPPPAASAVAPAFAQPAPVQRPKITKPKPELEAPPEVAAPVQPLPRPAATASFPAEPSAPATKPLPSKGVIVRDAPF